MNHSRLLCSFIARKLQYPKLDLIADIIRIKIFEGENTMYRSYLEVTLSEAIEDQLLVEPLWS